MIKKLIEKIINLLLAKQLLKQKQLSESFNNNVQLLNIFSYYVKSVFFLRL